jgi:DNA-binding transcriptional MerR regulator
MEQVYTITALAKEFQLTTRAIRHYEDEGLLQPAREGGNRQFSHRDRVRLKLALRCKRLGYTLAETRELFSLYDKAREEPAHFTHLLTTLQHHRALLEQKREDLAVMLNEITFFEQQCRQQLASRGGRNGDRQK